MCNEKEAREICYPKIPFAGECCDMPPEHKHTIRSMNSKTYGGPTYEDTSDCPVCNPKEVK